MIKYTLKEGKLCPCATGELCKVKDVEKELKKQKVKNEKK